MLALPDDIIPKDVSQWLEGGWFYADTKTGMELCCLQATVIESKGGHAEVSNMKGKHFTLPYQSLYAHWPVCGSLNIPPWPQETTFGFASKYALSLMRLQKKQWKRTYNTYCLRGKPIADINIHVSTDHYPVVAAAFDPTYFSYSEIMDDKFNDGWASCAINPNIILLKGDKTRVFVDGEIIGLIDKSGFFTCINPGLKRRLLPYFDNRVG